MLRQRKLKQIAVTGLAAAMLAPAGAAARPAGDVPATAAPTHVVGQAIAAGGGSGLGARDREALGRAAGGVQQDLRAPDQVAGSQQPRPVVNTAPRWPLHPGRTGRLQPATSSGADLGTGLLVALGGLAAVAFLGAGYLVLVHTRRPSAAA
jgi:hypothetical protein